MLQKEWYELNKLREELHARKVVVGAEEELNRVEKELILEERQKVDAYLSRVTDLHRSVHRREEELNTKIADDDVKFKEDRAKLDSQLREAGLDRKNVEELLFRARLDGKTVRDLWKELEEEEARARRDSAGSSFADKEDGKRAGKEGHHQRGSKEGQQQGGDPKEEASKMSGLWSTFCALLHTPKRLFDGFIWSTDTYWAILIGSALCSRVTNAREAVSLEEVEKNLREKHDTNVAKVDVILDGFGLPPKQE